MGNLQDIKLLWYWNNNGVSILYMVTPYNFQILDSDLSELEFWFNNDVNWFFLSIFLWTTFREKMESSYTSFYAYPFSSRKFDQEEDNKLREVIFICFLFTVIVIYKMLCRLYYTELRQIRLKSFYRKQWFSIALKFNISTTCPTILSDERSASTF